jgi:hypothetical protein
VYIWLTPATHGHYDGNTLEECREESTAASSTRTFAGQQKPLTSTVSRQKNLGLTAFKAHFTMQQNG